MTCLGIGLILFAASAVPSMATRRLVGPLRGVVGGVDMLQGVRWPAQWPFKAEDVRRQDESPDKRFYSEPRLVTHIDDGAIAATTAVYSQLLGEGDDVLDLCSSWISHLPDNLQLGLVVGLGMNAKELEANPRLTSHVVADLNEAALLPFDDSSFDAVLNAVSVDYLTRPREVFNEMHRVLRPGGVAVMTFSNRMFPTKAVDMWLRSSDDVHVRIVGTYFATAGSPWVNIQGHSMETQGRDPLYAVIAYKAEVKAEL